MIASEREIIHHRRAIKSLMYLVCVDREPSYLWREVNVQGAKTEGRYLQSLDPASFPITFPCMSQLTMIQDQKTRWVSS
jgi:hypothetical protein